MKFQEIFALTEKAVAALNFMGPSESRDQHQLYFCVICGGPGSTKHHLVPRKVRQERGTKSNGVVRACSRCHHNIHYYISHWELAVKFNTEKLLKAELNRRMGWNPYPLEAREATEI